MPFLEKGNARIRYEEAGSGFLLFIIYGGGLNSKVTYSKENIALAVRHVRTFLRANRPASLGETLTRGQGAALTPTV